MERYECTYRVNYNKQYLEDILDEECKGKKKLSNATLKKKGDSWEMDFHVMEPVKHVQRAPAIRHPNIMDIVFEDEELKELLDDCYAFSYYYYYCLRFLNFERG